MNELRQTKKVLEKLWSGYNQTWQMVDGNEAQEVRKELDCIETVIEILDKRINYLVGNVSEALEQGKIITWTGWERVTSDIRYYRKNLKTGNFEYSDDLVTWKISRMRFEKIKLDEWRILKEEELC